MRPPAAVSSLGESSVTFRVTPEMVARFAALTGDRSSLHVSESIARRSAYRRPVVHGMLPVAFLPLLRPLRIPEYRCVPIALSGRFHAPAYADDSLKLTATPGRPGTTEGEVDFEYRIDNATTGASVTSGAITVVYDQTRADRVASAANRGGGVLVRPIELSNYLLEQIEKGMKDRFDFRLSAVDIGDFMALLAQGGDADADYSNALAGLDERFFVPNLLSLLLFSTSVGVSLPGASATFLEFSGRVESNARLDTPYALEAEVVHRSVGTRIIKKNVVVRPAGRDDPVVLRGKVATLVNQPVRAMPSIGELQGTATELGISGKVALITGASRGIGETIAKLLALHGARVVVNYNRGRDDADRVVAEITGAGGDAFACAADVTRAEDVRALVEASTERYGGVDILVNNAVRDYRPIPFANLTWEEVQQDLDVIAKGAFHCCQAVLPLMVARGGGKIVSLSSVAVDDPPADQTKYVMAKSALVGLTRSLSIEYAARNIQVNLVVPSFVETDLVAHIQEGFRQRIARDTPMGRHALALEVAQAVLFLASAFSSFTTGQKIMVTGGGAPYL